MGRLIILLCFAVSLVAAPCLAAESLVVIVSKENPNNVDLALIKKIYLGSVVRWPSGAVVTALNQPEDSQAAAVFDSKVLGKSVAAVRDMWAQNVFTGKGMPPKVHSSEESIKRIVSRSKNAIGYISSSSLDDSVKVVYTVR